MQRQEIERLRLPYGKLVTIVYEQKIKVNRKVVRWDETTHKQLTSQSGNIKEIILGGV